MEFNCYSWSGPQDPKRFPILKFFTVWDQCWHSQMRPNRDQRVDGASFIFFFDSREGNFIRKHFGCRSDEECRMMWCNWPKWSYDMKLFYWISQAHATESGSKMGAWFRVNQSSGVTIVSCRVIFNRWSRINLHIFCLTMSSGEWIAQHFCFVAFRTRWSDWPLTLDDGRLNPSRLSPQSHLSSFDSWKLRCTSFSSYLANASDHLAHLYIHSLLNQAPACLFLLIAVLVLLSDYLWETSIFAADSQSPEFKIHNESVRISSDSSGRTWVGNWLCTIEMNSKIAFKVEAICNHSFHYQIHWDVCSYGYNLLFDKLNTVYVKSSITIWENREWFTWNQSEIFFPSFKRYDWIILLSLVYISVFRIVSNRTKAFFNNSKIMISTNRTTYGICIRV
jgi:hypothetical protein